MPDPIAVQATFTPHGGEPETRTVILERRARAGGDAIYMRGGPTGWESFYLSAWQPGAWEACFGSDRYAQCVVPAEEMHRAIALLAPEKLASIESGT